MHGRQLLHIYTMIEKTLLFKCSFIIMIKYFLCYNYSGYPPEKPELNEPMFNEDQREIHLNWTVNITRLRPVDHYRLVWRRENDRERQSETTIITRNNSYVFTNVSDGESYTFWVIAINEAGPSNQSNEHLFNTHDAIPITRRNNVKIWVIVLIVICSTIALCICCILCLIFCLCCCVNRSKIYYAEERGKSLLIQYICSLIERYF